MGAETIHTVRIWHIMLTFETLDLTFATRHQVAGEQVFTSSTHCL